LIEFVAATATNSIKFGNHEQRRGDRVMSEPVFATPAPPAPGSFRVLGIDPGLTRCGYAIIDGGRAGAVKAVSLGVIRTPPTDPLPQRLAALRHEFEALIAEFAPHAVAVEQVFFQVNVRTAMSVGQASGLALAEAAVAGCEVVQYTPNQVKDAVAGWGGADKEQVQKMVQVRLGLSALPKPADAADAAALALCHLAMSPMRRRVAQAHTAQERSA
jgi:crossover junction endodeoxyribonuclease RuvC